MDVCGCQRVAEHGDLFEGRAEDQERIAEQGALAAVRVSGRQSGSPCGYPQPLGIAPLTSMTNSPGSPCGSGSVCEKTSRSRPSGDHEGVPSIPSNSSARCVRAHLQIEVGLVRIGVVDGIRERTPSRDHANNRHRGRGGCATCPDVDPRSPWSQEPDGRSIRGPAWGRLCDACRSQPPRPTASWGHDPDVAGALVQDSASSSPVRPVRLSQYRSAVRGTIT